MVRKYKQRPAHQKHTRSFKKIYYRKYTSQNKINHTRRSGSAKDLAAQKYKANQKIKLEKRQGTQKDAYVKCTQYQNACTVSTMQCSAFIPAAFARRSGCSNVRNIRSVFDTLSMYATSQKSRDILPFQIKFSIRYT